MKSNIPALREAAVVVMAFALAFAWCGPAWAVTLPYSQEFSSPTTDFTFTTPAEWSVGGGVLNLAQEGGNSRLSTAAVQIDDSLAGVPLAFSANVQASQLLSNSDFGLAAYGDSPSFALSGTNHYIVDFKPNGSFRLLEVNDGVVGFSITAPSSNWFSFSPTDVYALNFTSRPVPTGTELTLSVFDPTPGEWRTISGIDTTPVVGSYFGLRARTSGQTRPITGWFDDVEISQMTNKIMHGDFDRLPVGTKPDNGLPIGGWQIHQASTPYAFTEANAGYITIAQRPGAATWDHALRINVPSSNTNPVFAEQLLPAPWSDTENKLILTHEHITNADGATYKSNGNWTFVNGGQSAIGPYVGLHDRPAGGSGHKIRYWGAGIETPLASYTPGETYEFRTSVDMSTKRFDLFVRGGPEFSRWTQIGKQLQFLHTGTGVVDRLQFGEFYSRTADAYIDNVSAVSSADLPEDHIVHRNSFNYYASNVNLVNQNDGWTMGEGAATPASAQVVPDTFTGKGNVAKLVAGTAGPYQRSVYQDLDLVVDSGKARFDVDAMWTGGVSNSWGYFGIGDSNMTMTLASNFAGLRASAGLFGFHGDGGQLRLMASDGDYLAGSGSRRETSALADTWYTFVAEVQLTGPDRNTWDLHVFERDTETLVWEQLGMDFVTDYTDILRFGAYAYDAGGNGTLYFDNLGVNIPEPSTVLLLMFGGLMFLGRRRTR